MHTVDVVWVNGEGGMDSALPVARVTLWGADTDAAGEPIAAPTVDGDAGGDWLPAGVRLAATPPASAAAHAGVSRGGGAVARWMVQVGWPSLPAGKTPPPPYPLFSSSPGQALTGGGGDGGSASVVSAVSLPSGVVVQLVRWVVPLGVGEGESGTPEGVLLAAERLAALGRTW
ncbi:hypothetical protein MMPV_001005 [Pyropia vietnamensis]